METINLNVYPYFDDFNEDKNFYRILFRPGVAVQARELTQIQSILQNQISKIGNYLFKDGSRVPGTESAPVSINTKARAIRLQEVTGGVTLDVQALNGLWVNGATTDIVGEVKFVYEKDEPTIGDPPTIVITLANGKYDSINQGLFAENEILYFYEDRDDAINRVTTNAAYLSTTAIDTRISATGTVKQGSDEIVLINPEENIRPGDYVFNPNIDYTDVNRIPFVTQIETSTRIGLSTIVDQTLDEVRFDFIRKACTPTLIVTVDAGTYYKNGTFIKSQAQSVVPDKYNGFPSKALILRYSETIVTSSDDTSLLDPSIGSSNYFAPGADRLKYELMLESINLDEANQSDIQDTYIEVMRFIEGRRVYNDPVSDATGLRAELAKRTYDESGNYIVKEFVVDPIQVAYENANVKYCIYPGSAYVGGYEVTTVSPTYIEIPKARNTETEESFNINTNYGNYVIIRAPNGGLVDVTKPDAFVALEVHSVLNPQDSSTRIGYLWPKNIEYYSGAGVDTTYKLHYYYYFPGGASAAPLSWTSFSAKYDIPVDEAQFIAQELYSSNKIIATIDNVNYYSLFREPDVGGLAYWWNVWKTNNEDLDLVKELFITAILAGEYTGAAFDQPRIYTSLKDFAITDNNSPFYDTQFSTDIGLEFARSMVAVDNTFNPNGRTYANPAFKAAIATEGLDADGKLLQFDNKPDSLVFPLTRAYVKEVDRLSIQYSKVFFDQQFSNGQLQLSVGGNETFAAADGELDGQTIRNVFLMVGTTDSPGTPLSWNEFSVKYEIPVNEAQEITQRIYQNNDLITTVSGVNYYGLYREPDVPGVTYWWNRWQAEGGTSQALDSIVITAILEASRTPGPGQTLSDYDRTLTDDKSFLESNNDSPFYDTEYFDEIGGTFANYVPLDQSATVTISNDGQLATIQLSDITFNGYADILALIDNDDAPFRVKTYNTGGATIVDVAEGDVDYNLYYADIIKFHGVYQVNPGDTWRGIHSPTITYQVNDLINFENNAYRALRQIQDGTSPRDDTQGVYWEELTAENLLRYYLDDGVKDNWYAHGAIRYLGSDEAAPGLVLVLYDYHTHSGEGPLVATSYPVYDEIPTYYSKNTGKAFSLRDCLDFRPISVNGQTPFLNINRSIVPSARFLTEADITYYVGRRDRLYVTNKELSNYVAGERFFVDRGIAALKSQTPVDKSDATQQLIYTLEVPPYTINSDHVKITYNDVNRYTMSDIGDIDKRLELVENTVRRQGLEILALNDVITGGDGRQLFKAGVFLDDFSTRSRANITSPKFRAWINIDTKECRPAAIYNTIDYNVVNTDTFMVMDNMITMPATQEAFITQNSVTGTLNVNPGGIAIDPILVLGITSSARGGTPVPSCDDNLLERLIGRSDPGDLGFLGSVGLSCDRGGILGIFGDTVDFFGEAIEGVADLTGDIVDGIVDGVTDGFNEVGDYVDDLGRHAKKGWREFADWF
jgi:hypothetical protein